MAKLKVIEAPDQRLPKDHGQDATRLRITEIFFSLQGESTHAGLPCAMVRLTGCNLRCVWCDTEYSFHGGQTMTVEAILGQLATYPTRRVELTGGEPLLQKGLPVLAGRLLQLGYEVLCETSGERDLDLLPIGVKRIMDLKAPGSGELEQNRWDNLDKLRPGDEVKFVLADRADFDWMVEVVRRHQLTARVPVLAAPVEGTLPPRTLAEWILESGLDLRLNLQLHKLLWGTTPGH